MFVSTVDDVSSLEIGVLVLGAEVVGVVVAAAVLGAMLGVCAGQDASCCRCGLGFVSAWDAVVVGWMDG